MNPNRYGSKNEDESLSGHKVSPYSHDPKAPQIDFYEHGKEKDGLPQRLNRRLFMQLLVFDVKPHVTSKKVQDALYEGLQTRRIPAVIYADASCPRGLGLLTWSENPEHFVTSVRSLFEDERFSSIRFRHEFSMFGRTYSLGYEPDLEHVLFKRSIENALHESYPWHIWYPLRRSGEFAKLDHEKVAELMREHGAIGLAYGQTGFAHDIRLACHGMDTRDNEYVVGLVGKELHPLSHLVQTMRKTKQTSSYIVKMGPFFVGHVVARLSF